MPTWFLSDGLRMVREGDYVAAGRYYEARVEEKAVDVEGWLGLGAAWQGRGRIQQAVGCYAQGLELDESSFPLEALALEATPGKPEILQDLAVLLSRQDDKRCCRAAIAIFGEVMASTSTSRQLYMKADSARRKARESLEWLEARDKPALMSLKKAARRGRCWRILLRGLVVLVLLAAIPWFGWRAYLRSREETSFQRGMLLYVQAHQMATYGSSNLAESEGKDPYQLYTAALGQFCEALRTQPTSFEVNFMVVKAGQQAIRHLSHHFGSGRALPTVVRELNSQVEQASTFCRQADPGNLETRRQEGLLEARVDSQH